MQYRRLGKSGLQISAISFGSWLTFSKYIDNSMAEKLMVLAYDHGINFFDNAEGYNNGESETEMGSILKKLQWNRETFLVSSKVFFGTAGKFAKPNQTGLSRKHVFECCHAALKRFQLDHLDLYFCHRPDPNTPIEETVSAMNQLIAQGKILYWGTSEWSAKEIKQAADFAKENHKQNMMAQIQNNRKRVSLTNLQTWPYGLFMWICALRDSLGSLARQKRGSRDPLKSLAADRGHLSVRLL